MIKVGKKHNLPTLIFKNMATVLDGAEGASLLYRSGLSFVFVAIGVDVGCDVQISYESDVVIDRESLYRFGFEETEEGKWIKKHLCGVSFDHSSYLNLEGH